jgi:hypothetical protein
MKTYQIIALPEKESIIDFSNYLDNLPKSISWEYDKKNHVLTLEYRNMIYYVNSKSTRTLISFIEGLTSGINDFGGAKND